MLAARPALPRAPRRAGGLPLNGTRHHAHLHSAARHPRLDGTRHHAHLRSAARHPHASPGDNFKVTFSYLQPLVFEAGRYKLQLPTRVPDICLPPVGASAGGTDGRLQTALHARLGPRL